MKMKVRKKINCLLLLCFMITVVSVTTVAAAETGWKKSKWVDPNEDYTFVYLYIKPDGSYAEGWTIINNKQYYFDFNNRLVYGCCEEIDNVWYAFDNWGVLISTPGWKRLRNYGAYDSEEIWYCYINDKGVCESCWRVGGVNTEKYGHTQSPGWKTISYNGQKIKIYIDNNGNLVSEWLKLNDKKYYFDYNCTMVTGWYEIRIYNKETEDYETEWFYFDQSGVMQTGWIKIKDLWYYFNDSGVMQTGWMKYGGQWYYLNGNGDMNTGWLTNKGNRYYMDVNGVMQTGWLKINKEWYYFNSSGVMQTGTRTIGGKTYTFNASGVLVD